jgi:hypothetical protein
MRSVILFLLFTFLSGGILAEQPSWFPKDACYDVWYGDYWPNHPEVTDQTAYIYDFENHKSYEEYVKNRDRVLKVQRKDCYKKWTILIAMDADNDLMAYSLWDLLEMESAYKKSTGITAGSTLRKDVIVQHHGLGDSGVRRLQIFQTDREFYSEDRTLAFDEVNDFEGKDISFIKSPVISTFAEAGDSEKGQRFFEFLDWGMREFPAEHYMVILWGHGKGWLRAEANSVVHLRGDELAAILRKIKRGTLEEKKRIDLFVADACFMSGIELVTELSPHVRFFSGSAQIQSFLGLPYRTLFYNMNKSYPDLSRQDPTIPWGDEPAMVAKLLPRKMHASIKGHGNQGRVDRKAEGYAKSLKSFTFTSVDTTRLQERLLPALELLANQLIIYLTPDDVDLAYERANAIVERTRGYTLFFSGISSRELGAFIYGLEESVEAGNQDLLTSIELAKAALNETVVETQFAKRYDNVGFQGLGMWIPRDYGAYSRDIQEFRNTYFYSFRKIRSCSERPAWAEMMEILFAEIF